MAAASFTCETLQRDVVCKHVICTFSSVHSVVDVLVTILGHVWGMAFTFLIEQLFPH